MGNTKLDFYIKTKADLIIAVQKVGFLPLFRNSIPGFSVAEHAAPSAWFSNEPGVWEWKGPVIQELHCAYGKFFENTHHIETPADKVSSFGFIKNCSIIVNQKHLKIL